MPDDVSIDVLLSLTDAISQASRLQGIYDAALDGLAAGLNVKRASILLFDDDGVMRFKAWRGLSDAYRTAVEGHTPWQPDSPAPQPLFVPSVEEDESLAAYLPLFRAEGIAALAFIPLVSQSRVIGKFMLYYPAPYRPTSEETRLALAIAFQIAFAVERLRMQEATRTREDRIRFALEAARVGTWEWNLAEKTVRWSDNLEALHGLPPGSFDGTFDSYAREIHPEDREPVLASVQRAAREGAPHDVEYRIVAPDGTIRWVEGKGRVEFDTTGRPVRMTGICMDITRRKEAELERLEAQARVEAARAQASANQMVQTLLESAPDAIIVSDDDGRIVLVNDQVGAFFGYSREELLGQPVEILMPEPLRPTHTGHRAAYHKAPQKRPMGIGLDLSARRKDGSAFPAEISLSPLRVKDRIYVTAVVRDVSERKRLEEARRDLLRQQIAQAAAERIRRRTEFLAHATTVLASSLEYETTLQQLARLMVPFLADRCGVDLVGPGGELRRVAEARGEREQMDGEPGSDPSEWVDRRQVSRTIEDRRPLLLGAPGPSRAADEVSRQVQESYIPSPHSLIIVPLIIRDRAIGALSCALDEPREYTAEDLEFADEAARRAATAVEHARLYREAQEASRVKDEFLATLSHELRTPLHAILGWIHMLRGGNLPAGRADEALTIIERNARAQAQLIDDILDVSRIITGKLRIVPERISIAQVIDNAADSVRPAALAKGVRLSIQIAADVPRLDADSERLQQAIWNLLSNAVKFTPGGGEVLVSCSHHESEIRIVVRDTGVGIPSEFLPFIFDRFRQVDATPTRPHGGLGLGLAIARHLVELHGGSIEASSAGTGQGASFTIHLPLVSAAVPAGARRARAAAARERSRTQPLRSRLEGIRILVVDDDDDARQLVKLLLEQQGAFVFDVGSAEEALIRLRTEPIDLLIADIGMPGVDGYRLIQLVRELPPPGGLVPALALTAYARAEDRARALKMGYQAFHAKPLKPGQLIDQLTSLLGRRAAGLTTG